MAPKDYRGSNEQQKLGNVKGNVKVTYMERPKKSGRETSAEYVAGPSKPPSATSRKVPSPAKNKSDAVFKTPDNPIRIVDFRTETSPKRTHADMATEGSEKSSTAAKKKPLRHHRSSSSITAAENVSRDAKSISSGPPSRAKPLSAVSKVSQSTNRSQTPASETNDNVSIAESTADTNSISGNRIKRTENERKQYFENQPECGSIEARRAFCTRCKEWVRLSSRQTYYVKPWEMHRAKCDQKLPVENTYKDLGLTATIPFIVPRTEKARKALLELDETAEIVEPNQIKCKTCRQWVPLEKKYNIKCWTKHKGSCHNNIKPVDIEKTLERKLFFLCDEQFKSFRDEHTVECAVCDQDVALSPDAAYDLDQWLEHKKTCHFVSETHPPLLPSTSPQQEGQPKPKGTSTTPAKHELSSAQPQPQPSQVIPTPATQRESESTTALSTTDSERTLVPSSSSASAAPPSASTSFALASMSASTSTPPVAGPGSGPLKRKRDALDDEENTPAEGQSATDDVDMDEERPTRRLRTESYIPEDRDAPSPLGWFLLPFKAFVKGFKESLTKLDE